MHPQSTSDQLPLFEKRCKDCSAVLPRTDFYRNARKADGLYPYCKRCASTRYQKQRARHTGPCSEEGCQRPQYRWGLCHSHYLTGRDNGTLKAPSPLLAPLPPEVTALDLAWMAGLWDGEGAICISRVRPHNAAGHPIYELMISINMTSEATIRILAAAFGGNVNPYNEIRRRQRWNWVAYHWKALRVLRALRPYLRLKGPQADLAFAFMDLMVGRHSGSPPLTQAELAERSAIYEQMAALNNSWRRHKRGPLPPTD